MSMMQQREQREILKAVEKATEAARGAYEELSI